MEAVTADTSALTALVVVVKNKALGSHRNSSGKGLH